MFICLFSQGSSKTRNRRAGGWLPRWGIEERSHERATNSRACHSQAQESVCCERGIVRHAHADGRAGSGFGHVRRIPASAGDVRGDSIPRRVVRRAIAALGNQRDVVRVRVAVEIQRERPLVVCFPFIAARPSLFVGLLPVAYFNRFAKPSPVALSVQFVRLFVIALVQRS